eukprot:sb/3473425/
MMMVKVHQTLKIQTVKTLHQIVKIITVIRMRVVTRIVHWQKQPIRTRYLGHVTGYQPIRDQYFLIRSVPVHWQLRLVSYHLMVVVVQIGAKLCSAGLEDIATSSYRIVVHISPSLTLPSRFSSLGGCAGRPVYLFVTMAHISSLGLGSGHV